MTVDYIEEDSTEMDVLREFFEKKMLTPKVKTFRENILKARKKKASLFAVQQKVKDQMKKAGLVKPEAKVAAQGGV